MSKFVLFASPPPPPMQPYMPPPPPSPVSINSFDTLEAAMGGDHTVPTAIMLVCLGLLVGTTLRFFETQLVPLIRIKFKSFATPPYTLSVFLVGSLLSAIYDAQVGAWHVIRLPGASGATSGGAPEPGGGGHRMLSSDGGAGAGGGNHPQGLLAAVHSAQLIDPHIILLVFLPPLIYESSSKMNYHTFHRVRWQALLLAFPGVIIQTFLTAAAMRYWFGYGSHAEGGLWDWDVALTFGAIVCATDPVAVVATLHEIGAPEKLADVIDGESLLNDGSAMVVFGIFLHNVEMKATGGQPHTFGTGTVFFCRLVFGGALVGVLWFNLLVSWLSFVENDFKVEVALLVVAVYSCFSFSELVAGVSGVLAVVTFGLLMGRRGKYTFSPAAAEVVEATMGMLSHFSETMIFFVAGIAAWTSVSTHQNRDVIKIWHAIPLYFILALIRVIGTGVLYPLLKRTGYSINVGECAVVVYAGLRGAVGLSLGLLVYQNKHMAAEDRDRIHFLVGSIVVLTMAVNGTTTQALYNWLALYPANKYRDVVVHEVVRRLESEEMERIRDQLIGHEHLHLYQNADWEIVRRMVPDFTGTAVADDDRLLIPELARPFALSTEVVRRIAATAPTGSTDAAHLHHLAHIAKNTSGSAADGSLKGDAQAPPADGGESGRRRGEQQQQQQLALADFGGVFNDDGQCVVGELISFGDDKPAVDPRSRWRSAAKTGEAGAAPEGKGTQLADIFSLAFGASASASGSADAALIKPAAAAAAAAAAPAAAAPTESAAPPPKPHAATSAAADAAADPWAADPLAAPAAGHFANVAPPTLPLSPAPHPAPAHGGGHGGGHGEAHGETHGPHAAAGSSLMRQRHTARIDTGLDPLGQRRRLSRECSAVAKRDELVDELFRMMRVFYMEQYENKQLAGEALSACLEALSSGEEYLAEHPHAQAAEAFELELDVLLFELPRPNPRWMPRLLAVPVVGRHLWRHLIFRRTYEVTEALAAFVHAHLELQHACHGHPAKLRLVLEAVGPTLERAKLHLEEHRRRYWSLTTLQINLLTARAAIDMKRRRVMELAHAGDLKHADEQALVTVLNNAIAAVDTMRYSIFAPRRFHRKLKLVLKEMQEDARTFPGDEAELKHTQAAHAPPPARAAAHAEPTPTPPAPVPPPPVTVDLM